MGKPVEKKIVEAVGVSANSLSREPGAKNRSKLIEAAMVKAIEDTRAKGITDPVKIREAMMEARERVKKEIADGRA